MLPLQASAKLINPTPKIDTLDLLERKKQTGMNLRGRKIICW
jgi:hypothetical protein